MQENIYLITIEAAFGERKPVIEQMSENHKVITVSLTDEIWLKESLLNRAMQEFPAHIEEIAWIDPDIMFFRKDWVGETLHQLQRYDVVQMWSEAFDLSPDFEVLSHHKSFMWVYKKYGFQPTFKNNYYNGGKDKKYYLHPGFAWAAKRSALDAVGGLLDWAILGGGDMYMAYALVGALDKRQMPKTLGESGKRWLQQWQDRAEKFIKRNVGYVSGGICHYWHGAKVNRAYKDRGQILIEAKFDPEKDLWRSTQGIWQLNPDNQALRDGARAYFSQRNEDDLYVPTKPLKA